MNELISKEKAIEVLERAKQNIRHNIERAIGRAICEILDEVENGIKQLPSTEEESFEWCTDCKEYDQEQHCCHRWSKMIRKTVEEMRIVRCKDCKYAEYIDDVKTLWCTECGQGRTVAPNDFCSYAERRTNG